MFSDWLIGSSPILILFAFKLSFSHAIDKICSAWTDVRWAGVGREGWFSHPSLVFLLRRQDFKYVRSRLRARSEKSGNWRAHESIIAWTFSFGCFEIGIMRSRFSSTNKRTNICGFKFQVHIRRKHFQITFNATHVECLESLRVIGRLIHSLIRLVFGAFVLFLIVGRRVHILLAVRRRLTKQKKIHFTFIGIANKSLTGDPASFDLLTTLMPSAFWYCSHKFVIVAKSGPDVPLRTAAEFW